MANDKAVKLEDLNVVKSYINKHNLKNGKGKYSIQGKNTEDRKNIAEGEASFAGGHRSKTYQRDTFAYGGSCQAGMTYQEWITANNKTADPNETNETQINEYATSYGFSWAGGEENKAKGRSSLALIQRNIVNGIRSGAIGVENIVDGDYSLALGNNNEITDEYNQIVGTQNKARSKNSQMIGRLLHTDTDKQVLLGHHNLRDEQAMLIVGNGDESHGFDETSAGENGEISFWRRNAMTIKKNGAFHTDSRVNDNNLPVIEYYVENGQVKIRVVEGEYDKDIFHIHNLSFGDTSVDFKIDKDGTLLFKTLNHSKENGLGEGYSFKQLTVDKYGRVVIGHSVNVNDENPVVLDIKNYGSPVSQLKVKADGQVIGRHSTQDNDEDGTLTTKDFVLRKISENSGSGGKTYYKYNCEIASEDWSYWGKFSFISSQTGITLSYVLENPTLFTGLSIAIHNQENTEHIIGIIHDIGTYNNKPKLTIRTNEGFLAYNLNTEMGISTNNKVEL